MSPILTVEPSCQIKKSAITYLCRERNKIVVGIYGSPSLTLNFPSDEAAEARHLTLLEEIGWPVPEVVPPANLTNGSR